MGETWSSQHFKCFFIYLVRPLATMVEFSTSNNIAIIIMQEHDYKTGYVLPFELSDAVNGGPTVRETLVKGWFGASRKIPRLWGDVSFLLFESHEIISLY